VGIEFVVCGKENRSRVLHNSQYALEKDQELRLWRDSSSDPDSVELEIGFTCDVRQIQPKKGFFYEDLLALLIFLSLYIGLILLQEEARQSFQIVWFRLLFSDDHHIYRLLF